MKINVTIGIPVWLDKICVWPLMWYRRRRFGFPFRKIRLIGTGSESTGTGSESRFGTRCLSPFLRCLSLFSPMFTRRKCGGSSSGTKSKNLFTIVDPDVFYLLNPFVWFACGKDDNLYAARVERSETGRLKTILMHRQILNAPPDRFVDHRNNNSLDNRLANLRLATPSQNSCNTRRDKSKTYSRYRGVSFSKRKNKWFAAIRVNGKKKWLGYFDNELDAAKAYDEAAKKYHGEFAQLNFK